MTKATAKDNQDSIVLLQRQLFLRSSLNTTSIMKLFIVLRVLVASAFCAPMPEDQLGDACALFKRVYQKQYNSLETSGKLILLKFGNITSKQTLAFTLGMNQFGDLVRMGFWTFIPARSRLF